MYDFKIGDRVKLKDGVHVGFKRMTTKDFSGVGTIKDIGITGMVRVCFDEYMCGHNLFKYKHGYEWYVDVASLMSLQEEHVDIKIEDLL